MVDAQGEDFLNKAIKSLEKYFFMIAFANFIETTADSSQQTFADWLKARSEIWTQISFLRKASGSKLNVFVPVNDLSSLSKSGLETRALLPGTKNDVAISGGQILGDEYSDHVVKHRSGIILRESMLLKSDQWLRESHHVEHGVRGAINFRQIPDSNIYALDYGGISGSRLEVLEERLRDDVLAELESFGGRLLLHTETPDGAVVPVWEEVHPEDVMVLKDVMGSRRNLRDGVLQYNRVPITAEKPPEHADIQDLIEIVLRAGANTPIVVNCQLGRGRSTLASIILVLIRQWLQANLAVTPAPTSRPPPLRSMSMASAHRESGFEVLTSKPRQSYTVINNLLRVVRRGHAVKTAVDDAIDQCSAVYHLTEAIEEAHTRAEEATDQKQKQGYAAKGIQILRRYFELIVFQAYLQSTEPDTMESFAPIERFVKERPVIKTFEKELHAEGLDALKPLERAGNQEGVADPDEVTQVVQNRSGTILSVSTILKSDFFSNLQKMTLPERIDGSPNFRRVPLALRAVSSGASSPNDSVDFVIDDTSDKGICGSGMPTVEGLKKALERVDAGPNGKDTVYWTSLREEPVIYVAGRPHVLRQVTKPLENLEATGVTTAVVEAMEENFKKDVLRELRKGNGRILLHDEVEERPGVFSIIPIWEFVSEDEIMTPRDVFTQIVREGFRIDYSRVAITDEQAPLPDALSQLLDRVQSGIDVAHDFIFNCQMGRGRTTTGMVSACLIASTLKWEHRNESLIEDNIPLEVYDPMDGPSEEEAYLAGEYKTILHLVGVLSHGKVAKRLTDRAIDLMQDVQNLRKAIYDYKLKVDACQKGTAKFKQLSNVAVNYLYRYGTLIVFANYLIELRERTSATGPPFPSFPVWLREHREITKLLSRRTLD
ncbi:hypothetical protein MD484_g2993, partial [Candolleomyces efflorescens]